MPETFTTTVTLTSFGSLLHCWRVQAHLSASQASREVSDLLPGAHDVSYMTLVRYEDDMFPKGEPDTLLLAALLRVYGRSETEIPPHLRVALSEARSLLGTVRRGPAGVNGSRALESARDAAGATRTVRPSPHI